MFCSPLPWAAACCCFVFSEQVFDAISFYSCSIPAAMFHKHPTENILCIWNVDGFLCLPLCIPYLPSYIFSPSLSRSRGVGFLSTTFDTFEQLPDQASVFWVSGVMRGNNNASETSFPICSSLGWDHWGARSKLAVCYVAIAHDMASRNISSKLRRMPTSHSTNIHSNRVVGYFEV